MRFVYFIRTVINLSPNFRITLSLPGFLKKGQLIHNNSALPLQKKFPLYVSGKLLEKLFIIIINIIRALHHQLEHPKSDLGPTVPSLYYHCHVNFSDDLSFL